MDSDGSFSWAAEASAAIEDVRPHVKAIALSDKIPTTCHSAHFNVETLEGEQFCVELSRSGYALVGRAKDKTDSSSEYFETPYSMLAEISPGYRRSFGDELGRKLSLLTETE